MRERRALLNIKQYLGILFCCLFVCPLQGAAGSREKQAAQESHLKGQYIAVEDYFALHPDEKKISMNFGKLVQGPPQAIPSTLQGQKVSVAIVYPGEQVSDYWRRSLQSFIGRMQELAIDYEISEYFTKGGGVETRIQEKLLKEALAKNPDYLVFTLDVNRHKRLIERILAKGRPRLFLQNITTPLVAWEENQPFYVGFDHVIGTRMLADYFLRKFGSQGSYGLLYYSQGYVSRMRGDTFHDYMHQGNGPRLAASFYTDGSRENARKAVARSLGNVPDLQFIYACSTDVALGAVDGLKEAGTSTRIAVNGWGGGSAELAALAKGDLDVTVMRMNDDNGVAMAEAIRLELLGRKKDVPTIFSGEFILVTGENSPEELNALRHRAFRYSGIHESR